MPTRQYVGARYVPKFADPIQWDITRAYEALEIVTNLGTSYTSKKPVPVGVAISNTEYWVATGNYNAQVEQYREETEDIAKRVSLLDDDHYIIVGDSYSINRESQQGWSTYLINYLGLTEYNGSNVDTANCWRACIGSRGFIGLPSEGSWLSYIQANYPSGYDKNKVTKIIIGGGGNDRSYTKAQIATAINTFAEYVALNFPNAKVYLFCFAASLDDGTWQNSMWTVYNAYSEVGAIPNWCYCSGLESFYHRVGYMLSDYHHPTSAANEGAARIIKDILCSGTLTPFEARSPITMSDGVTSSATSLSLYSMPKGLEVEAFFPVASMLEFSTPQTFGTNVQIGTLTGSFYYTFSDRGASFTSICIDGEDNEHPVALKLMVDKDGKVYLRRASSPGYGSYTKVMIPPGCVLKQPVFLGG